MSKNTFNAVDATGTATSRGRARFGLAGLAIAGALALGIAGAGALPATGITSAGAAETAAITAAEGDITLAEQVAETCLPSMGSVYALIEQGGLSGIAQGSCEVIDASGVLLTNYHVVDGSTKLQVAIAGETFEAELVGSDPTSDIAVLRIDPGEIELTPIAIGSSAELKVGQWVMTLGAPKGESESVSQGIVSGLNRSSSVDINDETSAYYVGLIQSDAMINEGSSGGAMVNANGELVGVTTLIATQTGDFAGMSYAIPVDYAMNVAGQILQNGVVEHPLFGASVTSMASAYLSGYYQFDDDASLLGAYVYSVVDGLGADAAGIEPGDVVVALDGQDIYSAEDLILAVRSHSIGDEVTVTVQRGDEELDFQVTLSSDQDEAAVASRAAADDEGEDGDQNPFSLFEFIGGQGGGNGGDGGYGYYDYTPYGGDGYGYYGYYGNSPYGYYGNYGYGNPGQGYGYGNPGYGDYGYYGYGNPGQGYGYGYGNSPYGGYGQYEYYGYPNQGYGYGYGSDSDGSDSNGNSLWDFLGQLGQGLGIGF